MDVFGDLGADFEAEEEGGGEEGGERDEETAKAAADVCYGYWFCEWCGRGGGVGVDEGWVVEGPIHLGGAGGAMGEGWLVCQCPWEGRRWEWRRGCTKSVGGRRRGWRGRAGGRIFSGGTRCCGWIGGFCGILRAFGAWLAEALWKDRGAVGLTSIQLGSRMGMGVI